MSSNSREVQEQMNETLEKLKTGDLDKYSTERSIFNVQMQSLREMHGIALKVGQSCSLGVAIASVETAFTNLDK